MNNIVFFSLSALWLLAINPSSASATVPEFEELQSVVLAGVHYDAPTQTLLIRMRDDTIIEYSNVPREIYEGLKGHPLKGGFYRGHIVNRYPSRVVPPDPEPEEVEADEEEAAAEASEPVAAADPIPQPEPAPAIAEASPESEEIPTISVVPAAVAAVAADMPELGDDFDEMLETTVERAEAVAETLDEELFSLFDETDTTLDEGVKQMLDDAPPSEEIDDLLQSLDDLMK